MQAKADNRSRMGGEDVAAIRASISFPGDVHVILETIAREREVSLAGVVRETAVQYLGNRRRLFSREEGEHR